MGAERAGSWRRKLRRSARRLARRVDRRRLVRWRGEGSPLGLRTAKMTLAASVPGPQANQAPLLRALARAHAARDDVAKAMAAGPREEPEAWQVHGHLLANVDRLLSELDPEGQTWPGGDRPA